MGARKRLKPGPGPRSVKSRCSEEASVVPALVATRMAFTMRRSLPMVELASEYLDLAEQCKLRDGLTRGSKKTTRCQVKKSEEFQDGPS